MSVIGAADPAEQLALCAELPTPGEAASCVRGTKVQNLLGAPTDEFVRLIRGCERPAGRGARRLLPLARQDDHRRHRRGVRSLRLLASLGAARRECAAGARSIDDALVTFS